MGAIPKAVAPSGDTSHLGACRPLCVEATPEVQYPYLELQDVQRAAKDANGDKAAARGAVDVAINKGATAERGPRIAKATGASAKLSEANQDLRDELGPKGEVHKVWLDAARV